MARIFSWLTSHRAFTFLILAFLTFCFSFAYTACASSLASTERSLVVVANLLLPLGLAFVTNFSSIVYSQVGFYLPVVWVWAKLCFVVTFVFVLLILVRITVPRLKLENLSRLSWLTLLGLLLILLFLFVYGGFFR